MGKPDSKETEPLFWAYGHAVYAAQLLERGMRLLLEIIRKEREKSGVENTGLQLEDIDSIKMLGILFKSVKEVEHITNSEEKIIYKAIKCRNILVHSYWSERQISATLTPEGRKWLIDDLMRRKEDCRKAEDIISSLIDRYLSIHGTTIEALAIPLYEKWQNDELPPDDVIH